MLFSYTDQFRQENADNLVLKLPIDSKGEPDWQYMEEYIKKVEIKAKENLNKLTIK